MSIEIPKGAFHFHPGAGFAKKLDRIKRADPPGYARILDVIGRVLENPDDADGKLTGPHRGKWKKYAGRSAYRLIYAWCNECRKANRHLKDECGSCEVVPDDSVVFFDVFHKSDAPRLNY